MSQQNNKVLAVLTSGGDSQGIHHSIKTKF